ncbi:hypothetical protein GYMLUDRAFT_133161, partial [Collybiopsis luxurians FD-317 M1]
VNYCISHPVVPRCQLEFNLPLLVIVIVFNIVKVICMALATGRNNDKPLVTIGDAIASFIDDPDPHTKDMCLVLPSQFNAPRHNQPITPPHAQIIIRNWAIPTQGYGGLIASVLVANSPQLILSMIYIVFNSLCTNLFLALEWSSYANSRKPLRVSSPRGEQRSTYFLQIPHRFGLPLMAYSTVLHWLVSQSIFLIK